MSPIIHKKAYQEFLTLLKNFQSQLPTSDSKVNPEIWQNLEQFFQEQVIVLSDDDLDESIVNQWRSLQRELQREFRLLTTDLLFLKTSRQTNTRETRLETIRDRLTRLCQFSTMICEKIN